MERPLTRIIRFRCRREKRTAYRVRTAKEFKVQSLRFKESGGIPPRPQRPNLVARRGGVMREFQVQGAWKSGMVERWNGGKVQGESGMVGSRVPRDRTKHQAPSTNSLNSLNLILPRGGFRGRARRRCEIFSRCRPRTGSVVMTWRFTLCFRA